MREISYKNTYGVIKMIIGEKTGLYTPTEKEIETWYQGLKGYKYGLEDPETLEIFKVQIKGGAVLKRDYGIYYLTNIHDPVGNAYGHCYFWDKRVKGRDQDIKEILETGMELLSLHRITALIPVANGITSQWLERVGFEIEGYMKAYMVYRKQLFDMYIFAYYSKQFKNHIEGK